MRRVRIEVDCDACGDGIDEETEGDSVVTFTVRGEQREMDICGNCLGGTFLQEARPVSNRKKRKAKEEFLCKVPDCGKTFTTQRGLSKHENAIHNPEPPL